MLKKLIKKPAIRKFLYKCYYILNSLYLKWGKLLFKKFEFERSIHKLSSIAYKKNIGHIHIINGKPHVIKHGLKFSYIPESRGGSIHVLEDKYEHKMVEVMSSFVKSDSTILDVGAGFGFFSLLLSKKLSKGKIYSFEPVPETFGYLKENVKLNALTGKIIITQAAVSDNNSYMNITIDRFGGNHLVKKHLKNTVRVKTWTLDEFFKKNRISKINLIKCDVEGAELFVLNGAKKIISKFKPIIVLEIQQNWTERAGYNASEIFLLLNKLGYNYKLITSQGLKNSSGNISKDIILTNNFLFMYKGK